MPLPESEYVSNVWKDGIFDNSVVFVTGGAGTICSAQTRAMVRLGADACIIGRNVEKTEAMAKDIATARPGAKVIGIGGCDVRSFESLEKAAERCVAELGSLDYVIAGAAGNFIAPLSGLSPNGFKAVMDIDVLGTFNTIKATVGHLVASARRNSAFPDPSPQGWTGGRIIYVSATFHYTGVPLQSHVSAAKASIDSLMASVALEYGPLGVTSNVVAPGPVRDTEGMARLASSQADMARAEKASPAGRWATVRDIADVTVFLFSDAGNHVNGQVLPVDGGMWRRQGGLGVGLDAGMEYPEFLIGGEFSKHLKGGKKDKSKL